MINFYKYSLLGVLVILINCNHQKLEPEGKSGNKFTDSKIRKIYLLQDERNTEKLLPFLENKHAIYRETAALAFASVQDPAALPDLIKTLTDTDPGVRYAAAFAIGQTKDAHAEQSLVKAFHKENSSRIKARILEAIGQCGTSEGLLFVNQLDFPMADTFLYVGKAWSIYRFGLRQIVSKEGTSTMVEYLNPKYVDDIRFIASAYLGRTDNLDLTRFSDSLAGVLKTDLNGFVRMNIATSLGKVDTKTAISSLNHLVMYDPDYRVRINAIRALQNFDYIVGKKNIFELLFDKNKQVAYTAAAYFLNHGSLADFPIYFEAAKNCKEWRTKTTLLSAAIKYAGTHRFSDSLTNYVEKSFAVSDSRYERGALLRALEHNPNNHTFIAQKTFDCDDAVVGNYGLEALAAICKNDANYRGVNATQRDSILLVFLEYFRKGIASKDIAQIGIAAGILRDQTLNFRNLIADHSFLKVALDSLKLPKEMETYIEMQKTINYFEKREGKPDDMKTPYNHPLNTDKLKSYSDAPEVTIKTAKGDIKVILFLNETPGSVLNFMELIRKGFYKGTVFHRVAPNFVIQGGCPRGDGWGSSEHSIRSEFSPIHYGEGYLGMASAGKDTEGCQWFITHSPTPHLDGNYTVFGRVVEGMDVVENIEIGDAIVGFEVVE